MLNKVKSNQIKAWHRQCGDSNLTYQVNGFEFSSDYIENQGYPYMYISIGCYHMTMSLIVRIAKSPH